MSMGYGAAYADCIEESTIKKFCPKEFKALEDSLEDTSFTMEDVAREEMFDSIGSKEVHKAFVNLKKAFEKKTGLSLSIGYHDSENDGDCYDQISGIYWAIDGMYQLTPAGKKMNKYVERKTFVQFG